MKITTKYNKGQRVFWKILCKTLIGYGIIEDVSYDRGDVVYYVDTGYPAPERVREDWLYIDVKDVPLKND